ncbi:hypothetical protein C882_0785 [Caenispirillum salinarum AK4]|uniref:PRC-barrel domain-containing protein n=2 Tax=Caenispirillum TaxID=414051 RepID=K9GV20_9PROT|nr:hypothetical protein C882_0785 [Caenispirillum salinarum AK4]
MPALAADEVPKTEATGTEAAAEQTEQMPEQAADDAGMAEGQDEQAAETDMTEDEAAPADEAQAAEDTGMAGDEQPAEAGMAEGEPAAEDAPATATAGDTTGSGGPAEQVDWAQYVGMPLMSDTGEELGEISTVVAGPDGQTLVIIERGGFLGLGRKQYAMMPQDLRVDGETVVAPMTSDQIAEMPEYEEPEPTE